MRALVTGSTGFTGGFLSAALRARGIEVHALSQRVAAPGVQRADLTSSAAWAAALRDVRPDYVFHLSAVTHSPQLSDFVSHNTLAAAALLDALGGSSPSPQCTLFVGTAAEYGLVPEAALPVLETFPAAPRSPYGVTKYAQTQLALDAARRGQRIIVVRPSNIVGPGMPQSTALGSFARQLREIELGQREPALSVGDLSTSRDLIDVRDVAQDCVALAAQSTFSGLVNVASGEHVVMRAVLDRLIAAFGVSVRVEVDSARLRAADLQKFSASAALLHATLGEHALTPLAQTLRDVVAHERSQPG